jgi:hypothetical protein
MSKLHRNNKNRKYLICLRRLKKDFDGVIDETTIEKACLDEWKQNKYDAQKGRKFGHSVYDKQETAREAFAKETCMFRKFVLKNGNRINLCGELHARMNAKTFLRA